MKSLFLLVLAFSAASVACQKQEAAPSAPASVAAPVSAAPSASKAPEKPWYQGTWTGTYTAERFTIELPIGNVPAWSKDDGRQGSGAGKIALEVAADGSVSGTAEGPLGKHIARGSVDADTLRVEFIPEAQGPQAFRGVMLASREGESAKGELRASSGDSLTVRRANVTLTKKPQ